MERRAVRGPGGGILSGYPAIEAILPHRAPMILLDRVEEDSPDSIACSVTPHEASPFAEHGSVPAVVATEYMAQCVAAYAGLKAFRRGEPIRIGYLIGARTIEFSVDRFPLECRLLVRARRTWGDDALGRFDCSVERNGDRVASAVLTVLQRDLDALESSAAAQP